jgi:PIN domain nuclease of toxin-antitoxin system
MILLDTHIWVWWVNESERLSSTMADAIRKGVDDGLGVSIISCWEVAKLVENGRLKLAYPVEQWLHSALNYPGVVLLDLTPKIVVESTRLPGTFHKDPADQLIVATARVYESLLLTADTKITAYEYVKTFIDEPG